MPSTRVAYNVRPSWAVAIEHYADFGPLRNFYSGHDQSHQIFAVFDHTSKLVDMEFGAGIGVTANPDKFQLKLILSRDLNN